MTRIETINQLFSRCFEKASTFKSAKKTSDVDHEVGRIIKKDIPAEIEKLLNNSDFLVCGSIGRGLVTKTPWVAILDKDITTSTREGVYIVFLFSSDYKHVYLTLNQGTTIPGQFGPRLSLKTIVDRTRQIRAMLKKQNATINVDDDANIADKKYKAGAICCSSWDTNDADAGQQLLDLYLSVYKQYKIMAHRDLNPVIPKSSTMSAEQEPFSITKILNYIQKSGLIYSDSLVKRFAFSLMSKRFLILSGLAGSGKTKLATAFAGALAEDKIKQMCVVSVGADWTNREPLLGFQNTLQRGYVRPESGVLDLMIEANRQENSNKPFFLILDEMNMSYVERYFADFLSSMESEEKIRLWGCEHEDLSKPELEGVPSSIELPQNLFIIGTINVDETTYMFSPKVLDRANVIEFTISSEEMGVFLKNNHKINSEDINGKAAGMGMDFVRKAKEIQLIQDENAISTLKEFFIELKKVNAEFGYRSAIEIFRFIYKAKNNDDTSTKLTDDEILDAAIVQKLLPKLHGSRKKLVPVLTTLWNMCETGVGIEFAEEVPEQTKYPLTADKLLRMYRGALDNGFTSFAEA